MKKKITVLTLCAMLFALSFCAEAQQAKKVPRIGFLGGAAASADPDRVEAFRQGLRELGHVEGQNIAIEYRHGEGKRDRLPELAAELVRLKVDCIVAAGTLSTHAVKQATSLIPIVMTNVGDDPVQQGFVASLARPGGNITGFTVMGSELAGKRLELLKETFPKISRVGILWDSTNPSFLAYFRETELAARPVGVQLQNLEYGGPKNIEDAFRAAAKGRVEGLIVVGSASQARILEFSAKGRLPAMYGDPGHVISGGLMSYAPNFPDLYRRSAIYVDKILKGTKPADLPVERPTKFELIVNLKAAKQIGLTIPPNVLARADRVIK